MRIICIIISMLCFTLLQVNIAYAEPNNDNQTESSNDTVKTTGDIGSNYDNQPYYYIMELDNGTVAFNRYVYRNGNLASDKVLQKMQSEIVAIEENLNLLSALTEKNANKKYALIKKIEKQILIFNHKYRKYQNYNVNNRKELSLNRQYKRRISHLHDEISNEKANNKETYSRHSGEEAYLQSIFDSARYKTNQALAPYENTLNSINSSKSSLQRVLEQEKKAIESLHERHRQEEEAKKRAEEAKREMERMRQETERLKAEAAKLKH